MATLRLRVKTIIDNKFVVRVLKVKKTATVQDVKQQLQKFFDHITTLKFVDKNLAIVPSVAASISDFSVKGSCQLYCTCESSAVDIRRLNLNKVRAIIDFVIKLQCKKLVMSIQSQLLDIDNLRYKKKEYDDVISSFIEKPLSPEEAETLTMLSDYYVIAENNARAKCHVFICYNTSDREGANEEVKHLCDAFTKVGFVTNICEWASFHELSEWIINRIEEVKDTCSLLFGCMMSHGFLGHLTGTDGSYGAINELLHLFHSNLLRSTPLVMIVQACQGSQPTIQSMYLDANRVDPKSSKYIELTRPHTALLMATVMGGAAVRGVYTRAIADQIKNADGITDITLMHKRAVRAMRGLSEECMHQVPELRDTLERQIVIPKPTRRKKSKSLMPLEALFGAAVRAAVLALRASNTKRIEQEMANHFTEKEMVRRSHTS